MDEERSEGRIGRVRRLVFEFRNPFGCGRAAGLFHLPFRGAGEFLHETLHPAGGRFQCLFGNPRQTILRVAQGLLRRDGGRLDVSQRLGRAVETGAELGL